MLLRQFIVPTGRIAAVIIFAGVFYANGKESDPK